MSQFSSEPSFFLLYGVLTFSNDYVVVFVCSLLNFFFVSLVSYMKLLKRISLFPFKKDF